MYYEILGVDMPLWPSETHLGTRGHENGREVVEEEAVAKSDKLYESFRFLTYMMLDTVEYMWTNNQLWNTDSSKNWRYFTCIFLYRQLRPSTMIQKPTRYCCFYNKQCETQEIQRSLCRSVYGCGFGYVLSRLIPSLSYPKTVVFLTSLFLYYNAIFGRSNAGEELRNHISSTNGDNQGNN